MCKIIIIFILILWPSTPSASASNIAWPSFHLSTIMVSQEAGEATFSIVISVTEVSTACSILLISITSRALIIRISIIFARVINEVALTHTLSQELLQSTEVLLAEILPEVTIFSGDEIIISQGTSCQCECHCLIWLAVKLCQRIHFVFQLCGHLIDLGRLHIHMIYLIPPNSLSPPFSFIYFMHFI